MLVSGWRRLAEVERRVLSHLEAQGSAHSEDVGGDWKQELQRAEKKYHEQMFEGVVGDAPLFQGRSGDAGGGFVSTKVPALLDAEAMSDLLATLVDIDEGVGAMGLRPDELGLFTFKVSAMNQQLLALGALPRVRVRRSPRKQQAPAAAAADAPPTAPPSAPFPQGLPPWMVRDTNDENDAPAAAGKAAADAAAADAAAAAAAAEHDAAAPPSPEPAGGAAPRDSPAYAEAYLKATAARGARPVVDIVLALRSTYSGEPLDLRVRDARLALGDVELLEQTIFSPPLAFAALELVNTWLGEGAGPVLGRLAAGAGAALRRLNLAGNDLYAEGAGPVLDALPGLPALEVLDLSHNRLGPEGAAKAFDAVCGSARRPVALNLAGNEAGDEGAALMATASFGHAALELDLSLRHNGLTAASAGHVCSLLASAVALVGLDLSENALGDGGVGALAHGLRGSPLKRLKLDGVGASEVGLGKLLAALKAAGDDGLDEVSLNRNDFDVLALNTVASAAVGAWEVQDLVVQVPGVARDDDDDASELSFEHKPRPAAPGKFSLKKARAML